MSRIQTRFDALRASGRKALIPYVTAGDPSPAVTLPLMHALVAAGADVLELGVPFSDPMADGPVIQLACERALMHGTRLLDVLEIVAEFRKTDTETPVVLMGYLNPIEAIGYANFAEKARAAGVDGVLTVDLPPEEGVEANAIFRAQGLDTIYLMSPATSDARLRHICQQGSGYLYYVSLKGVTGSANLDVEAVAHKITQMREMTDLPLAVGFGIRDAASAAAVSAVADGVIVGSVLVNQIAELVTAHEHIPAQVSAIIAEMRQAMDA
ncbi:tryptophan synthase subunit alpha [Nitrincola tapanii]|uniref:Tryptophan synthase alpha chain n=1 Tax=Nitrincola tapanii TaxID=1708751 RepID=A0A5A9W6V3_9GAMM|nr:tryptophan synthase subunit alpha [Nitrincola tapanii]KAA0875858.1 tryptophan synthase subunit alpha [Nitrincola tapanii]